MTKIAVSPYLTVKGAKAAIKFYGKIFDAKCSSVMEADDGERIMHATLMIQGNPVMLSDEFPEFDGEPGAEAGKGSPVAVSITLKSAEEVDRIYNLAIENGSLKSHAPEDMFWGDRFCQFYDPFGHRWMLLAPTLDK